MDSQSGYVDAGWMGVDARKYVNGRLCAETGYLYNGARNDYQTALEHRVRCGAGVYYSWGVIAVWNGGGYDYYYSPRSPNLNG